MYHLEWGFPGGSHNKESTCNAEDLVLIPGLGRFLGEGNENPLQCYLLENSMDREAWWATICGVAKSQTQLALSLSMLLVCGCESWTIKKSWALKNWCFWTVVLEKTLVEQVGEYSLTQRLLGKRKYKLHNLTCLIRIWNALPGIGICYALPNVHSTTNFPPNDVD